MKTLVHEPYRLAPHQSGSKDTPAKAEAAVALGAAAGRIINKTYMDGSGDGTHRQWAFS